MVNFLITLYLENLFKKIRKGTKIKNNMKEQYDYLHNGIELFDVSEKC